MKQRCRNTHPTTSTETGAASICSPETGTCPLLLKHFYAHKMINSHAQNTFRKHGSHCPKIKIKSCFSDEFMDLKVILKKIHTHTESTAAHCGSVDELLCSNSITATAQYTRTRARTNE